MVKENNLIDLDDTLQSKYTELSFRPIFIMGIQRSGTSLLYKMLNTTNQFNVVTAYHIIYFDQLIYNHINGKEESAKKTLSNILSSQEDRGIDRLHVTPDFPEEYGFLLAQKTKQSKMTIYNITFFNDLCKKVQFLSDSRKPLLLKNPFDFSNFIFIKKMFPEAKFIFIHRNPLHILNSQLKAMRNLLEKKSVYMELLSPWYHEIFSHPLRLSYYKFIYSAYVPFRVHSAIHSLTEEFNFYLKEINQLNEHKDYINVRYEDLCGKPKQIIESILTFADIQEIPLLNYLDYIHTRKTIFLHELEKRRGIIKKKLQRYISAFHYDI